MSKRYAAQKRAEVHAVSQIKEAEGIAAMADAYAKMATAFGGSAGVRTDSVHDDRKGHLAKANAEAICGLQPKISVWNTGGRRRQAAAVVTRRAVNHDATAAMRNVYQMLPPLMTTIQEQTGITLLEWQFGRMNASMQAVPL
ncbi:hypothetical protein E4U57_006958 [Claviceps arundinis]|uniref:Multiprotein-bridging factor 1 n=1 Tax=Claviceps arundinis TaxID=1623583 RepID=A0ABQ7P1W5_9HYPO|nr:hypothetical protein E4U57_006958 [Claviceps arundinis]